MAGALLPAAGFDGGAWVRSRPIVVEDFLPIPSLPIHRHTAGEAVAGSGWGGQDSAPVTQTRGSQNGLHISG